MNQGEIDRMSARKAIQTSVLLVLLLSIVFIATTVTAASDQIRLTVDNRNEKELYLQLRGPAYYFLKINGSEKVTFAIDRGEYDYFIRGCGRTASGTMDLTKNKYLAMPVCGGNATNLTRVPGRVDLGKILKVVKIKVENKTPGNSLVIFTGPSTYVFSLKKDASNDYTVAKGLFNVQVYACGTNWKTTFQADKGSSFKVRCP